MDFLIEILYDNGSGMKYSTEEDFIHEVRSMIKDCESNGGTYFGVSVDTDASCFADNDDNKSDLEAFKNKLFKERPGVKEFHTIMTGLDQLLVKLDIDPVKFSEENGSVYMEIVQKIYKEIESFKMK